MPYRGVGSNQPCKALKNPLRGGGAIGGGGRLKLPTFGLYGRRSAGGNLGGRPKTNEAKERLVLRLRDEGCSYRSIREQTGLALSTIRRIIAEQEAARC